MAGLEKPDLGGEDPGELLRKTLESQDLVINPNAVEDTGAFESWVREFAGSVLLVVSMAGDKILKTFDPRR